MNTMHQALLSISIGVVSGILYGLSFYIHGKKALSFEHHGSRADFIKYGISTIMRIAIFACTLYVLLLSNTIQPIFFLVAFLISFWAIVIYQKV